MVTNVPITSIDLRRAKSVSMAPHRSKLGSGVAEVLTTPPGHADRQIKAYDVVREINTGQQVQHVRSSPAGLGPGGAHGVEHCMATH